MKVFQPLGVVALSTHFFDGLLAAIARKTVDYPCTDEMVRFIWWRVHKIKARVLALMARIAAGLSLTERPARPHDPNWKRSWKPKGIDWTKWIPLRRFGWLRLVMRPMPHKSPKRIPAEVFAGQLRILLALPEMRAMLAATPKMARLLAPLCHMLGVEAAAARSLLALPAPAAVPVVESASAMGDAPLDTVDGSTATMVADDAARDTSTEVAGDARTKKILGS